MSTVIVDYGSGNLRSAAKAFERASGERVEVTGDASALARASHIVLPGVGAFGDCASGLRALPGMVAALNDNVIEQGKPFLGICVGMQLMATRGHEHGIHDGLDWIKGEVRPIDGGALKAGLKVPHMGWNDLQLRNDAHPVPAHPVPAHPVFSGIGTGAHAYFVHSYHFVCTDAADILAEVEHGQNIAAAIGRDNMIGTQFHPEKSQAVGLRLIENFLKWRP